jgi:hypothetical protein
MRVLHLACGEIRRERRIEFEGESLARVRFEEGKDD